MSQWLLLAGVVAAAGVALWLLVGDGGNESRTALPPSETAPEPEASRDCSSHIEGRLPNVDPRHDLILGPLRFRGFRTTSRFARRERGRGFFEIRNGEYHRLKFVTEVRAGSDVTIAIAPESRKTAGMLYGGDIDYGRHGIPFDEGEQAVRFRACPANRRALAPRHYRRRTVGPWTQFNGGFILTRPQCLRLEVYVRGRPRQRFSEPFARPRSDCGRAP